MNGSTAVDSSSGMSKEALVAAIAKTPFAVSIGAELTRFESGQVELKVPISAKVKQHHGFVHGAIVGFLADSACAWAAASVAGDVVTSEYKINFLAPAIGTELIGRGRVIKVSGRQVVCVADVYTVSKGGERLVATALGTVARISA